MSVPPHDNGIDLQQRVDRWLVEMYGPDAERRRVWFSATSPGYQAPVTGDELMRLLVGLLKCPFLTYHFDVHPQPASGAEIVYELYVEPADRRPTP